MSLLVTYLQKLAKIAPKMNQFSVQLNKNVGFDIPPWNCVIQNGGEESTPSRNIKDCNLEGSKRCASRTGCVSEVDVTTDIMRIIQPVNFWDRNRFSQSPKFCRKLWFHRSPAISSVLLWCPLIIFLRCQTLAWARCGRSWQRPSARALENHLCRFA